MSFVDCLLRVFACLLNKMVRHIIYCVGLFNGNRFNDSSANTQN